nr:homing endonuclease [Caudoviricetes sp.]
MNGSYKEAKICPECESKDLVQCQYCGNYYPNVRNEQGIRTTYYCSEDCNKRWNEECNTKTRICKNCGKSFIVHRNMNNYYSEDIYCSHDCMIENLQKQSINNEKPSVCKQCGKLFYQDRVERIDKNGSKYFEKANRKYCSDECYKKACQFSYNYQEERVCAYCGKKFLAEQYTENDEIVKKNPRLLGLYKKANTCSYECYRKLKGKHYKNTCLDKYGVTSCAKLESSKEKTVNTCMERYGVAYGVFTKQALEASKSGNKSKINDNFAELLEKLNIKYQKEFIIQNYMYDFYLPESNTLIELNPSFTHTTIDTAAFKGKDVNYHLDKTNLATNTGYKCINVWGWDDVFKIVVSCKLKQKLYARNLELKEITKQEANDFLIEYHLQNSCYGNKVNLGLYSNGQLVQVMTFGKPRYNKNYQWELLRLCSHSDYIVIGGAEKLFKYFINNHNPESIISYCDVSKFKGDVYERLGFNLLRQSNPQKIWNKLNSKEYITDNLLRQRGFDQLVGSKLNPPQLYGKGTNNEELMIKHNWLPVYDCGQKVFEWANRLMLSRST